MSSKMYISGKYFTGEPCKSGHIAERWKYNGMCVDCKRKSDRISNLKASKKYQVKVKYGLSIEQVQELYVSQNNQCAICKDVFGDTYKTQIDHCHQTGRVRGLLCINCNWLLGHSRDKPSLLREAANYLENTKETE